MSALTVNWTRSLQQPIVLKERTRALDIVMILLPD